MHSPNSQTKGTSPWVATRSACGVATAEAEKRMAPPIDDATSEIMRMIRTPQMKLRGTQRGCGSAFRVAPPERTVP
jgi:hypothetical protein